MNNQDNNNNTGNIDDILDILQKRKNEELNKRGTSNDAPTRVDNAAVKPTAAQTNKENDVAKSKETTVSKDTAFLENKSKRAVPSQNQKKVPQNRPVSFDNGSISLSDFDSESRDLYKNKAKTTTKKKLLIPGYVKVIIYLALVITVSCVLAVSMIKVGNDVFAFIKPDREITLTVDEGDTLNDISQKLYEADIIEYPTVYKLFSKFRMSKRSWLTGKFIEGEHLLNPSMNYDQLLNTLSLFESSENVVRVTIPEGFTIYEILDLFEEKGVIQNNRDSFIEAIEEFEYDYKFMEEMDKNSSITEDRLYRLEGYLFPDTYDFYVGENAVSAIDKLLSNFDKKFDESWYQRASDLGYTIDEIIILASIIEAEGNNPEDFAKISSVFHNRLKNSSSYPYLDSDATVLYSFQGEKKLLEKGDTRSRIHPYNSYLNSGLPPGPICSPGYEAIYAALYPETTNYYFFLTTSKGETVYSRTIDQHNAAIAASKR